MEHPSTYIDPEQRAINKITELGQRLEVISTTLQKVGEQLVVLSGKYNVLYKDNLAKDEELNRLYKETAWVGPNDG